VALPPPLNDWAATHPALDPGWTTYIRAQVAVDGATARPCRDGATGAPHTEALKHHAYVDTTDYLIQASGTARLAAERRGREGLERLQRFFAQVFAHRKQAIFAARSSERIYHVWLPPGSLEPVTTEETSTGAGSLAILPFVTFVRHVSDTGFRQTAAVSIVALPTAGADDLSSRNFDTSDDAHEIRTILDAILVYTSTYIPSRDATHRYRLSGPLLGFFNASRNDAHGDTGPESSITADVIRNDWKGAKDHHTQEHARDATSSGGTGAEDQVPADQDTHEEARDATSSGGTGAEDKVHEGTLRQWTELVVASTLELLRSGRKGRRRRVAGGRRLLPDDVLTSLRMTGTWCVLLLHDGASGASATQAGFADGSPPPESVQNVLEDLVLRGRRSTAVSSFPMSLFPRIDDPRTPGGISWTGASVWYVPSRRGVVTVQPREDERFPGPSSLLLIGVLGQLLIAASCSTEIMDALSTDTVYQQNTLRRAHVAHELLEDLEEMFELDIAYTAYRQMWRRFRRALDLDTRYRLAIERVDLLARYAEVEDREKTQGWERIVAFGAAAFGFGSLIFACATLFATVHGHYSHAQGWPTVWTVVVFLVFGAAIALGIVLRLRSRD
jgi:hypothetical protein